MCYVYVLQSLLDRQLYIGYTNDLKRRIKEHNTRKDSIGIKKPFRLIYYEATISMQDATRREHNLKLKGNSYKELKKRIKNCIEM